MRLSNSKRRGIGGSKPTSPPTEVEQQALAIYVVMGRDVSDALDMISECEDRVVLDFLLKMLTTPGSAKTDSELNALMAGPVQRRLEKLSG